MDCESRLIRTAILTPANVNDANENHVYDLIQGDEQTSKLQSSSTGG